VYVWVFNNCLPDDLLRELAFSNTFGELKLPIKGPMEDAEVIKLYEPSPTPERERDRERERERARERERDSERK
jgi:hypothetical protein